MISRLTACAAIFSAVATAGFAVAAERQAPAAAKAVSAAPMPVIVLPRVEITGKRPASR